MKIERKQKPFKHCPRCDMKMLATATKCEECGLIFARLEYATNTAAKEKIKNGDRDYILEITTIPKDVSYVKLLLYTLFLGIFGGQYYYVGKYVKGALMTLVSLYTLFCVIFNSQIVDYLNFLYLPVGVGVLAWMISCMFVICKKFKIPVSIEMTDTGGFKV